MTRRCFFTRCKATPTHTVQRLWQNPGKGPFPRLYCCDQHIPGSRARRAIDPTPDTYYRVEAIQPDGADRRS